MRNTICSSIQLQNLHSWSRSVKVFAVLKSYEGPERAKSAKEFKTWPYTKTARTCIWYTNRKQISKGCIEMSEECLLFAENKQKFSRSN